VVPRNAIRVRENGEKNVKRSTNLRLRELNQGQLFEKLAQR
jgi:hypothetical protein